MSIVYHNSFEKRHVGLTAEDKKSMLTAIGVESMDDLVSLTLPDDIRSTKDMDIPLAMSEYKYLKHIASIASKNKIFKSYIGQGYHNTVTPSVILRNIFQNPGWYTQYTPYQAEIAQGRLEALLNFQTMVADLTGLPIANASLLDEATAAAEAMSMFAAARNKKRKKNPATKYFIDNSVYAQTVDVMETRATPRNIEIVRGDYKTTELDDTYIGVLLQYPNAEGSTEDYEHFTEMCKSKGILVCVAADIMSLVMLKPPGEWGADAVVGNTQRFGVPLGYGGPHAGYFATLEDFKRQLPGRIIGVSVDAKGNPALRMALQTREQHIKREKATSNICTAQALLAIMAGAYAVYHGPIGLQSIAKTIHQHTCRLAKHVKMLGLEILHEQYFDTIGIKVNHSQQIAIREKALSKDINFYYTTDSISIAIDETTTSEDIDTIIEVLADGINTEISINQDICDAVIPQNLRRHSEFMTHEVFADHHTETKMMRYLKSLENKDLSLVHSMIALGSCTMKLNAATQLIPVTWPEFGEIHPFVPLDQVAGYQEVFKDLEHFLCEATGFTACSLQPNSGAQGEYAGLMTITAYHQDRGDHHRNIALIPSSAHGTNPASAIMAGMKVVVVKCDDNGNVDVEHLKTKIAEHKENLAVLLITYPSTHGVFETAIIEICELIHDNGGLVYMDGANMNAQVGLTNPGIIGADVCHLNLHKTFAIPHGGGGPGVGPICVNDKLAPYLPGHKQVSTGGSKGINAISAAPWGSASILLISYAYIKLLGRDGLMQSTKAAILNANYIRVRLAEHYPILYIGEKGMSAHELIIDLRQFKPLDVSAEDIAKRLIDYGFHAPTLSFPVPGTIMIEPTESEDRDEIDRFCEALISIKGEIDDIASGQRDKSDNVLKNAPHTLHEVSADVWEHTYTRSEAAYPLPYLYSSKKFWSSIARIDNAHGDRNLICTCPPMEAYEEEYSE